MNYEDSYSLKDESLITGTKVEIINLNEYESNKSNNSHCPKCNNDKVLKTNKNIDLPKALGFIFFLGASFAIVLIINAVIMIREKVKLKRLPKNVQDKIEQEDTSTLFGLNLPTKTSIVCSKCKYVFFQNYDTGDLIVVIMLFACFLLIVILSILLFLK
jgi:hypothetical protein